MTAQDVRVAFGMPAFNCAGYLEEALGSLLAQSYTDFVLVVVDDHSTDATPEIVARHATRDMRIRLLRNPERVGMVENWRRAFRRARELVPGLEYFAFASDHDVWHPSWLETLVRELDSDPDVVVAFPFWVPISEDGTRLRERPGQRWETVGVSSPVERARRVAPGRRAPNVIYGLFRARALERCGVYSFVLAPDRLLMSQLAVLGTFRQVPCELWLRRMWLGPRGHQRTRLFKGRPPLHTYLPTGLVHAAALFRWLVLQGGAHPEATRVQGLRIALLHLRRALLYPTLSRRTPTRRWEKRYHRWTKRHRSELRAARRWVATARKAVRRSRRRGTRRARSAARSIAGTVSQVSRRTTPPPDRVESVERLRGTTEDEIS